ncbi:MAG TPA: DUF922 domain-containing protein [Bauldia sp.]|nr:DUF922 domain-containing protein [Bauldia sp.]
MPKASRSAWATRALIGLAVTVAAVPVGADVRSSTEMRDYRVSGTSAASLVSFMRNNPFHGDRGAAVANIRPSYSLSVLTKDEGRDGICQTQKVDVNIRFVMTLPKATNALSGGTKNAWNGFVAFARKHEETHRGIYLDCANDFIKQAMKMTSATGCFALQANIRRLFEAQKRSCDARQLAFDRRDYRRVFGLSLFAMAKYPVSAKPAKVSAGKPAGSRSMIGP